MSKIKKICLVSSYFPPHVGGVERYVQNLSHELAALGHDITVVTTNSEEMKSVELINGVKVYRFPCYNIAKSRFPFLKKNSQFKEMFDDLSKKKFDAIVLNQRFYRITKLAVELSKATKSPLYLIEHVTGHFTVHNKILDYFGHIYEHRITAFLKRHISKAFGVSQACNIWLEHFGIKSEEVIHNGISENESYGHTYDISSNYGLPDDSKIFFHAGRLVEEKGILIMIEAFNKLIENSNNAYLVIAGDGPLLDQIIGLKNDRIIATGTLPHEKVMAIISQSDCTVIPSYYPEGLPTLILEAGYFGIPVIATNMGGTTEVIENNVNGVIVIPKSVEQLAEAMRIVISEDRKAKEMGENLHKKVMKQYTWDKIALKLIENL